jgi:hypothetical protein
MNPLVANAIIGSIRTEQEWFPQWVTEVEDVEEVREEQAEGDL